MSGKQREWLQWNREQFKNRNASPQTDSTTPRPTLDSKPGTDKTPAMRKKPARMQPTIASPKISSGNLPLLFSQPWPKTTATNSNQTKIYDAYPHHSRRFACSTMALKTHCRRMCFPQGPDAMTFLWNGRQTTVSRNVLHRSERVRPSAIWSNAIFGLPSQQIEGPKDLLDNAARGLGSP